MSSDAVDTSTVAVEELADETGVRDCASAGRCDMLLRALAAERDNLATEVQSLQASLTAADERCKRYDRMVEQLVRVAEAARVYLAVSHYEDQADHDKMAAALDALPPGMLTQSD